MESTSKEIALELLFLEGSGDRMRLLRIPRRSSSADVENLDAALWAMAQMDSEIRHGFGGGAAWADMGGAGGGGQNVQL